MRLVLYLQADKTYNVLISKFNLILSMTGYDHSWNASAKFIKLLSLIRLTAVLSKLHLIPFRILTSDSGRLTFILSNIQRITTDQVQ